MKRVMKVLIVSAAMMIPGAIDGSKPEKKTLVANATELNAGPYEEQGAFFKNFRDPKRIYTIRYFS